MTWLIRICPVQTQKSYFFNHTISNTFQPKTANARMFTRIKRGTITALYFYTSHLIMKCQHCPYILTFFIVLFHIFIAPVFLKTQIQVVLPTLFWRFFMLSISTKLVCEISRSQSYTTVFSFLFSSAACWWPFWLAETCCWMYAK